ncbi:MAG: alginate lyase family protein [Ignavibacteriaceae bacterium]
MGIFDYINQLNYNVVRKKIFRKEVESSFFNNKNFTLPKVENVTRDTLSHFKASFPFNFYKSEAELKAAADALILVEDEFKIIAEADKILENKYNIPGSGEVYLGEEINWHYDYRAKYKWHEVLVWRDNFFRFPPGADIKLPWEIARFHQGITLGKAYIISHDEKYTDKFLSLFLNFNEKNPFCIGVNWVSSDEAAIRMTNIFFSFVLFISSVKVNEDILNIFRTFILQHSVFIENNLAYEKFKGHEYLSNLLGLTVTGLLFRNYSYGKKNLQFAYSGFEQEIRAQILEDGVSYQQSLPFHSFILEQFYLGRIILEKAGFKFTDEYNNKLRNMFLAQSLYLREDNSIPQIGDSISSRLVTFNLNTNNKLFSSPLAAGKFLFKDNRLKAPEKGTAELIILFGHQAVYEYNNIITEQDLYDSNALQKGGHYILRNKNVHLFVEAGDIGKNGEGAPGHIDTFTFELFYKQKIIIIDPGTYSYYADVELRNFLRSVKAHNTFFIDNLQLAEFDGLFKVKDDLTKPKVLQWETNNHEDILAVQHFAYARLQDPVICKRTFHFLKDSNSISIKDEFFGGTTHEVISNLYFHPEVTLEKISKTEFTAVVNDIKVELNFTSSSDFFAVNVADAQYSPSYGRLEKTKKLNIILNDKFPVFINTMINLK